MVKEGCHLYEHLGLDDVRDVMSLLLVMIITTNIWVWVRD